MRALLIESQTLFTPFLAGVLEGRGAAVLGSAQEFDDAALGDFQPQVVLLDASHLDAPLMTIAELRAKLPRATIAVLHAGADPAWLTLARSFGANTFVGPAADEEGLAAALGLVTAA